MKKRTFAWILAGLLTLSLTACTSNQTEGNTVDSADTVDFDTARELVMDATISQLDETSALVTPVEGSVELSSADSFSISADQLPEGVQVGDTVEITYNGDILEVYPAMLGEIYSVTLVAKGEESTPEETPQEESAPEEIPALVMVDGILYYDSAEISNELRCGMMDGAITEQVEVLPTQDGQSNFSADCGYQYGRDESSIEVYWNQEWHIFLAYHEGISAQIDQLLEQP